MNGFFNNLFGTIAGDTALGRISTGMDFIPGGIGGEQINITDKGNAASWLGLRSPFMQLYAYDFCYPVAAVTNRLAKYDITGNVEILRASGKGKEDYATNSWSQEMRRLMSKPNPWQSWEQFRGQQVILKRVFGFCPVLVVRRDGFGPEYASAMINLPPWSFEAVTTGKVIYQTSLSDIIKEYKVTIFDQTITLKTEDVIILEDSFMQNHMNNSLLPQSRFIGLDMAVSNVCAAMEADNVLLKKKGPLGFVSLGGNKDAVGPIAALPETKDELQKDLEKYGMSWTQFQYVISRNPATWNPMSFNVKELGTKETVLAGCRAICQVNGFPYVLFEDSDATFSNQETAHQKVFEGEVIPDNKRDFSKFNLFFNAAENNSKIVCDYSHLAIFKEDELNAGRASAYQNQGLQIQYLNDIITKNQWLTAIGLDTVADGDLYYSQSNLKLSTDSAKAQADAVAKLAALENQTQPAK